MKRFLLMAAGMGLLLVVVVVLMARQQLQQPLNLTEQGYPLHLERGSNLYQVAAQLERDRLIPSARLLVWYARWQQLANGIKAGEYRLQAPMSQLELLQKLNRGEVVQHSVTLVEGWTVKQMLAAVGQEARLEQQLAGKTAEQVMELLGQAGVHPEGRFYPDTYYFTAGSSDLELLRRAFNRMERVLDQEWQQRGKNLPYNTAYEALIMASIVERETGTPVERAEIAGVFVRRLQQGMRLQTDPTVIYGLGDAYKGNITRAHLKQYTPYNTYRINGLPPTPIALPGQAAIHAALHPAAGNSLYFVAKGDGSHHFSATLDEHNKAVRRYQWKRSKDYHSRPKPEGDKS